MVCHPLPPPLPGLDGVASHALLRMQNLSTPLFYARLSPPRPDLFNAMNIDVVDSTTFGEHETWVRKSLTSRGFTSAEKHIIFCNRKMMAIIGTVEEGWVLLDQNVGQRRWERLGWLDCLVELDELSFQFDQVIPFADGWWKLFQSNGSWVWQDEGWRYEVPVPISNERLEELQNMYKTWLDHFDLAAYVAGQIEFPGVP